MNNLIIVGSGGLGREVANVAFSLELWNDIYFIDDAKSVNTTINGIKIIGNSKLLEEYKGDVFVAIGNIQVRKAIVQNSILNKNIYFPNIIHPSCGWMHNKLNKLGEGNYIGDGVIGTVNISIGNFNLINLGCLISHDTEIASFCNLMHGVKITSGASIHNYVNVGTGCSITSSIHIENSTVISPNSVIP